MWHIWNVITDKHETSVAIFWQETCQTSGANYSQFITEEHSSYEDVTEIYSLSYLLPIHYAQLTWVKFYFCKLCFWNKSTKNFNLTDCINPHISDMGITEDFPITILGWRQQTICLQTHHHKVWLLQKVNKIVNITGGSYFITHLYPRMEKASYNLLFKY